MRRLPASSLACIALATSAIASLSGTDVAAGSATAVADGGCHYRLVITDQPVTRIDIRFSCAGDGPWRFGGHRLIPNDHVRNIRPGAGSLMSREGYDWIFSGSNGATRGAYSFDMMDLIASTNAVSIAQRHGSSLITSISSLLLYPVSRRLPLSLHFSVGAASQQEGGKIATAFRRTSTTQGEIQWINSQDVPDSGFMVLGRFAKRILAVPGRGSLARADEKAPYREGQAKIILAIVDPGLEGDAAVFDGWVSASAKLVAEYFRGFPARRTLLVILPVESRSGVFRGRVISGGGPTVLLTVGSKIDRAQLYDDWILLHELIHIGSPYLRLAGRWLNEGIAVYLQSVIHVRAGWLEADRIWRGFMHQMPRGLDALQGAGLGSARGIGGVYWGGSTFLLLADIDIRRRTNGGKTLGDCLRTVLWAGGDSSQVWTPERMMTVCDKAVGTDTMARLASQYVSRGSPLDLGRLWRDLGLIRDENGFRTDNKAPLAVIREAIMRKPPR
ncbi:MAG: hypothetical protein OXD42_11410 [Rhodospirillaceae bacterium]|nr:hypothetical protein [Rhodospirillaceae bacterium]